MFLNRMFPMKHRTGCRKRHLSLVIELYRDVDNDRRPGTGTAMCVDDQKRDKVLCNTERGTKKPDGSHQI